MHAKLLAAMRELARWPLIDQLEIAERIWHEIRQRDRERTSDVLDDLIGYQPARQVA